MQEDSPRPGRADYLDFDLEIGIGTGRDYPVAVLDSPAGGARGNMHFPFDELVLENRLLTLQNALLRSGGEPRRTLSPEEQKVRDFGRALFEALFIPEVRSCYDVSLREAARQGRGLRLKLRIQPPELAALPWEYLYHPGQAEYVSLSTRTPVVRYLEVPQRVQPLVVEPPLRILGMIASPSDLPSLDIEREKGRIEQAIRDLRARGLVELAWLPGQSWRDLQRAMRQGTWHIFHFIGHGGFDRNTGEGLIALADREGQADRFHATQLGRLLADHASLRLVLLNSCEGARGSEHNIFSSTAAILVLRGIPAVLAMQYEITDRAAVEFAHTFYEALADGMPVDGAVAEARKAISFAVANTVEWGTPVLYTRAPGGVLFEVAEQGRRAALGGLYRRAVQAVEAGQWQEALGLLTQVQEMEAGYRETQRLLVKAEAEIEASRKPAALAEAASPKRRLPGWAMAAIGGLAVVAIVVMAVLLRGGLTPTPTPALTSTTMSIAEAAATSGVTAAPSPPSSVAPVPGSTPKDPTVGAVWQWSDGSSMVYVPAGAFWMGSGENDTDVYDFEMPQHEVYLDEFWIERTEVTNGQYRRCVEGGACRPPSNSKSYTRDSYYGDPAFDDYPIIYVDWNQADAYCAWAGKRLPTEAEWEKAARGTEGLLYPWEDAFDGRLVNFCDTNCTRDWKNEDWNDGYADTAPVGSYEGGASPYGALDMAGNVAEWVADWYGEDYYANSPDSNPRGPSTATLKVLRGGGWYDSWRHVRAAYRYYGYPYNSDYATGFRCVMSPGEQPSPTPTPMPVPTDTPLPPIATPKSIPEAGATRIWEKDEAVMVYVPSGTFWMGSSDEYIDARLAECSDCQRDWYADEQPQHEVTLDAFWIDRTEVTNAEYAAFLNEQGNQTKGGSSWLDLEDENSLIERVSDEYRPKDGYTDHPVVEVTWYGADAYCAWVDKRLPTEAEWEKAARGNEGQIYPWGNSAPDCSKAQYSGCSGQTVSVGNKPAGASPYGALDMAGNVWEWVADWYDADYYAKSPDSNPQGPDSGLYKVLRGGGWWHQWSNVRAEDRYAKNPDESLYDLGFRCVVSPGE